jgi:hypothetical protein
MFYAQPTKYTFSDIAEDLPGPLRAVSPVIKNVLPSATIISKDPEERKAQIRVAVDKIKNSGEARTSLGKEILHNVRDMGVGALAPGFLLASAFNLMGFRSPLKTLASGKRVWQAPAEPIKNIKKLLSDPSYAKHLAKDSAKEALTGAGLGAATAAAYPLFARGAKVSDKALADAQKIMEEQPYLTSLPAAEMLSAIKQTPEDKSSSPLMQTAKSTALGTGVGTGLGALSATTPALIKALALGVRNLATRKPLMQDVSGVLKKDLPTDIRRGAMVGGGAGALAGALTKKMPADETA